jgi:ABC-type long-subunit fatty acid transport system fused permease/ATPase subunit
MSGRSLWQALKEAWRLSGPYWSSAERWIAWLLLVVVIALNLAQVGLNVLFNYWRNAFYNSLQDYDEVAFIRNLAIFCGLAVIWVVVTVYATYLQQMLQIRWRRWLTDRYLVRWLDHRAYYKMQLTGSPTDNPDQRIADDLNYFTSSSLALSLGLLSSVVTLFSFVFILWSLSGPVTIPYIDLTIPRFMVWLGVLYPVVGTFVSVKIGRPLVWLNFQQQRFEADFRYSLVRLRENTESVAFYRGEPRELGIFQGRFGHVFDNFWAIMKRQKLLGWFVFGYGQASVVFTYIVQAPLYFAHKLTLGALQQTADAFGQVQGALSFIMNSYTDIANWQSVVQRLASFERPLAEIAQQAAEPGDLAIAHQGSGRQAAHSGSGLPGAARARPAAHRPHRRRQEHGAARHRRALALRPRQGAPRRRPRLLRSAKTLYPPRDAPPGAGLSRRRCRDPAREARSGAAQSGIGSARARTRRHRSMVAQAVRRRAAAARLRPRLPGRAGGGLPRRGDIGAGRGDGSAALPPAARGALASDRGQRRASQHAARLPRGCARSRRDVGLGGGGLGIGRCTRKRRIKMRAIFA